jgi:hypothetical protein
MIERERKGGNGGGKREKQGSIREGGMRRSDNRNDIGSVQWAVSGVINGSQGHALIKMARECVENSRNGSKRKRIDNRNDIKSA